MFSWKEKIIGVLLFFHIPLYITLIIPWNEISARGDLVASAIAGVMTGMICLGYVTYAGRHNLHRIIFKDNHRYWKEKLQLLGLMIVPQIIYCTLSSTGFLVPGITLVGYIFFVIFVELIHRSIFKAKVGKA